MVFVKISSIPYVYEKKETRNRKLTLLFHSVPIPSSPKTNTPVEKFHSPVYLIFSGKTCRGRVSNVRG